MCTILHSFLTLHTYHLLIFKQFYEIGYIFPSFWMRKQSHVSEVTCPRLLS